MGLSSALQWWDEWQLRVLVIASLGLQYILAIFAGGRRLPVPPWYRFLVWLSYLGSDALAIYALATLFNRQKDQQCNSTHGSHDLEVLWAPILLMHLGGQIFITAYNIEDNELWSRHIVTTISQVTVAIYVFCKSWSSSADKRLLAAAILLFFLGAAKCLEKSLSLKGSSFNSLARLPGDAERTPTKHTEEELELEDYVQKARKVIKGEVLNEYVEQEKKNIEEKSSPQSDTDEQKKAKKDLNLPHKLFLDSGYAYSDRITTLKFYSNIYLDDKHAYQSLQMGLSNIFYMLYTKSSAFEADVRLKNSSIYVGMVWTITVVLSVVAISLFHASNKKAYSSSDVIVSLVLLYGTFALDITSLFIFGPVAGIAEWYPDVVPQHSLIGFCANNSKFMKPCDSSKDITKLVRQHVLDGWKFITDVESYWEFNDIRGQWKLKREECDEHLGWSLEKPFDESILIWHMATDFCFHNMDTSCAPECANRSIEISNYMMHLLYANPEMLMAGSRYNLYKTACNEVKNACNEAKDKIMTGNRMNIFNQLKGILCYDTSQDRKKLTKQIIDAVRLHHLKIKKKTFFHDAWDLYEGLTHHISDETKRWEVIQGVWVEMLCFSASRCRGYLHAKSLGSGVEYLSYVWLLLAHAGMETFSERLQRTCKLQLSKEKRKQSQNQGEDAFASPDTGGSELPRNKEQFIDFPNQGTELYRDEETTAAPSASQGEGTSHELNETVVSS